MIMPGNTTQDPTGLNDSVIIIGGSKGLSDTYDVYNSIFIVMLGPKSLQQVAMQVILKHWNELPLNTALNCLPRKLLSLLDVSVTDQDVRSESAP